MNNLIKNSFDEKYVELANMLIYKKCNPPEVIYTPTFKINGIIHKIKFDFHGKGKLYEQYTYNSTDNKVAKLIYYHKMYDKNTLLLMRKKIKLCKPKRTKTKEEEEMEKKALKCIQDCNKFLEMLKKKTL